jgi:hypothetical protein
MRENVCVIRMKLFLNHKQRLFFFSAVTTESHRESQSESDFEIHIVRPMKIC